VVAQQPPLAPFIHQTRLDNGLDVIVVENHAVPLATVLIAVRNGAFHAGLGGARARPPVRAPACSDRTAGGPTHLASR